MDVQTSSLLALSSDPISGPGLVVSVMLGVATLIVVNSVMAGFSNKLKDRLSTMGHRYVPR